MSMNYKVEYDITDPLSIQKYAEKMIGKTFQQICDEDTESTLKAVAEGQNYNVQHENKKRKGGLGELIEERYFHYEANSDQRPDFAEAGVELKVTPYKKNKNGTLSAKERLIITMIDYYSVIDEAFEDSHLWSKARLILLVYYQYIQGISRLDYNIDYVKLFSPPEEDLAIIKQDYKKIIDKIKAGKAHELSEGDTLYLGAATKAQSGDKERKQPYSDIMAKPRAFSFKTSYMTHVLRNYIVPGKNTYESILKGKHTDSFEDYVIDQIAQYKGYSTEEIADMLGIEGKRDAKSFPARVAFEILGVKGKKAEEFEKANVVVKTIRIGQNNKIKENMSFPAFKFKELIEEDWETGTFPNMLRETRFFFVVYKFDKNNVLRLQGCQFWNMPYEDLETEVRDVWEKTKKVIKDGLVIRKDGKRQLNNLPKKTENRVSHVRPHAKDAKDTYELPDGRQYPKQSFWLNNDYILSQLNKDFFEE